MPSLVSLAAAVAVAVLVAACADTCERDADCPDGSVCDAGLCLASRPDSGGSGGTDTPCPDTDGDTVCDADDRCPGLADPTQEDADRDGRGDGCDPCPADPADDADGDGHCADVDLCPDTPDPDQADLDGDRAGDACDPDDDDDGSPDAADCRPRDASVYPGAADPCDWVDQDCTVGACRTPVTALGEGQRIVDVACLAGTRRCAVVTTTDAGSGSLLWLELGNPISLLLAAPATAPRGVAVGPWSGQPIAWITDATSVRAVKLADTGPTLLTLAAGGMLSGPVAVTPNAYLAVAPLEGSRLLLFDPWALLNAGATAAACGAGDPKCLPADLSGLEGPSGPIGARPPHRLAFQPGAGATGTAFLTFADDRRVAVLPISSPLNLRLDRAQLLEPDLRPAPELASNPLTGRLYAIDDAGAGALAIPDSQGSFVVEPFSSPDGACPTALAVAEGQLVLGDGCAGADPGLLSLDLDAAGLPIDGESRADRLPGCTPRRIVPVPGEEGSTPPVLAIACEGADALLVFGRD